MIHKLEVYGHAEELIHASACDCAHCSQTECVKEKTIAVYLKFCELLQASPLSETVIPEFIEISEESLKKNETVHQLLSMAQLEPAICLDGKLLYLGGFNPQGLLNELTKKIGEGTL